MPNGRPGDSRTHDVVHPGREVHGPACERLMQEIMARLPPARQQDFQAFMESWPCGPDGGPRDPDALRARLRAFRESLGPAPGEAARRGARAMLLALLYLLLGGLALGLAAGVAAVAIGERVGAAQVEGALAAALAVMLPLAAGLGGAAALAWLARRYWRRRR